MAVRAQENLRRAFDLPESETRMGKFTCSLGMSFGQVPGHRARMRASVHGIRRCIIALTPSTSPTSPCIARLHLDARIFDMSIMRVRSCILRQVTCVFWPRSAGRR